MSERPREDLISRDVINSYMVWVTHSFLLSVNLTLYSYHIFCISCAKLSKLACFMMAVQNIYLVRSKYLKKIMRNYANKNIASLIYCTKDTNFIDLYGKKTIL